MIERGVEVASVLVFFIGFYGVIACRDIVKSIVSIGLMEMTIVVFFLSFGFLDGMQPPIGTSLANVADPLPQSIVFTAVILGVAATAVNLTMLISLLRQVKTADWDALRRKRTEE